MKIASYTLRQLRDPATRRAALADQDVFTDAGILGLLENPRAEADDVLLFQGHDQGRVVASLGMLPDAIFWGGERRRFAWMHAWAASGGKAGGAGALLFLAAARVYRDQVGVSGCTEMAEKIYRSSRKLVELQIKTGASFYLRTNVARLVGQRYPKAAPLLPLLALSDRAANLALEVRFSAWRRLHGQPAGSTSARLDRLDPETARFIEEVRRPELFRRGAEELCWIRSLAEDGREDRFVRVHANDGRIVGLLYLMIRDGTLTVPYSFYRGGDTSLVVEAILSECEGSEVRDVLLYDRALTEAIDRAGSPILHRRPRQKLFLISKLYAGEDRSPYFVHDGDGDAFF